MLIGRFVALLAVISLALGQRISLKPAPGQGFGFSR